ncbi:hypothetical protein HJG39_19065, partial [Alteromonas sp. a30]|nr:hypothetical protein [Alteromonas sp. a30]
MLSTKVQTGATSPLHHLAYNASNAYSYTTGTNKISSIRLKDDSTVSFGYDNKGNQTH